MSANSWFTGPGSGSVRAGSPDFAGRLPKEQATTKSNRSSSAVSGCQSKPTSDRPGTSARAVSRSSIPAREPRVRTGTRPLGGLGRGHVEDSRCGERGGEAGGECTSFQEAGPSVVNGLSCRTLGMLGPQPYTPVTPWWNTS
ncbi:hypothetical protein SRB17_45040 [Streptomyces sp. RB17]|uniref:hypothetical protein n=1 Tax=Streptomyces sp. RB17 TaxID=2585197 RepID=UPI0012974F9D|nr:hypothetical protein [Streptomyces sp. RB17]MQY36502.1 hypothetical protein [Streptomyces sp. RB17]